ncbi:MAG: hypothetical protein ACRD29_21590 [Acidimicrobiales bacterium]
MPHPFLSDEWIAAARDIRDELRQKYKDRAEAELPKIRVNQVVTNVPFGDGEIKAHTDTTSGTVEMDIGHLDDAEATVTLTYDTAKAVMVDGNFQVAMQDFMQGKVTVVGDVTKLMAYQQLAATTDPAVAEINTRIKAITE